MANNDIVRRAVRCVLIANAAALAAVPTVRAQNAEATDAAAGKATAITEVIVTGSRITEPGLTSVSPVTSVTSEQIKEQGVTRIEDLLNTLPQVMADSAHELVTSVQCLLGRVIEPRVLNG